MAVARRVGDKGVLSYGLRELGSVYLAEGNPAAAARANEEALGEARAIGSVFNVLIALYQSVVISSLQNDPAKAKTYCFELWAVAQDTGVQLWSGIALIAFGLAAILSGEPQRGVRFFAAFEAFVGQHGITLPAADPNMIVLGQALERARTQLGPVAYEAGPGRRPADDPRAGAGAGDGRRERGTTMNRTEEPRSGSTRAKCGVGCEGR